VKRRLYFVAALGVCFVSWSPIAHAQQVKADTGAVAIGGNVSGSTINIGIPPEQLAALVRQGADLSEAQKKLIANLEGQLDINQRQIRAALDILGEKNVSPENLAAKLVEIAERFKALQATASTLPGDDPKVAALKADAQKAIDAGELTKADALLADVQTQQTHALENLAVNVADTSARRGQIALTQLRYNEAANHFANAASVLPPGSAYEDKHIGYLKSEALALYRQGDEFGDNGALLSALARWKRLVELQPRERVPLDWAATQNNLGLALWSLGERESGTAKLEEAVAAYREALQERTRERVPLDWATAQNNLGNALFRLGVRESGTVKLEEAAAAYREALQERTRERVPLDWALSLGSEGVALMLIAERRGDAAIAETALSNINMASVTLRIGGDSPSAWYFETLLPAAHATVARLRGR
jgi:tetratricopeptide (TPR) repeat protein